MDEKRFVTPLGNEGMYVLDTAAWRIVRPVMDKTKCVNCGICMGYCPVNSVFFANGEYQISYDYCKGCGLCAAECPRNAIDMIPEGGK